MIVDFPTWLLITMCVVMGFNFFMSTIIFAINLGNEKKVRVELSMFVGLWMTTLIALTVWGEFSEYTSYRLFHIINLVLILMPYSIGGILVNYLASKKVRAVK